MIKTQYHISKSHTITPDNSFIKNIEVMDSKIVSVTFQNNKTHYYITDKQTTQNLINHAKKGNSIGQWYNQYLKGNSL